VDLSPLAQLHPLVKAAILGVVEGATEFIPVSSTGHLIVAGDWLAFTGESAKAFEIFIQLGAILAIVWLYRADVARAIETHKSGILRHQLVVNLFVAFLPGAAIGLLMHSFIKEYLFSPVPVALALVLGGIAILLIERWQPKSHISKLSDMSVPVALGVGLAQVLALFPGVSRSGATIMGAYCLGLTRKAAAEFSFFLAIPTMIAAAGYDLLKSAGSLSTGDIPVFAVGFVVSFVSAVLVVRVFVAFVARSSFAAFAWYRIAFGALLLIWYGRHSG